MKQWLGIIVLIVAMVLVSTSCGGETSDTEDTVTPTGEIPADEINGEKPLQDEQPTKITPVPNKEPTTPGEPPPEEVPTDEVTVTTEQPSAVETTQPEEEETPPEVIEMEIASPVFNDGDTIPDKYSCLGQDISPELRWSGIPDGTKSFALILDDPDAPGGTFTHWVIFNIPADTSGLDEAIPGSSKLPSGALQGRNSFGSIGYGGPCPPPGAPHHYHFILYALDVTLDLSAGASKTKLINAMQDHLLSQSELVGIFEN